MVGKSRRPWTRSCIQTESQRFLPLLLAPSPSRCSCHALRCACDTETVREVDSSLSNITTLLTPSDCLSVIESSTLSSFSGLAYRDNEDFWSGAGEMTAMMKMIRNRRQQHHAKLPKRTLVYIG
ncbi:hypothetical protein B9Z55_001497 [Caenorhabditis nigoni]|nr:hypothetical protein B9Z55_001497 [Caenorhabditis nigoni]